MSLISNALEVSSSLESEGEVVVESEERTDFKKRYSGNNVDLPECETFEVARQTWLGMCFSWIKVFTSDQGLGAWAWCAVVDQG